MPLLILAIRPDLGSFSFRTLADFFLAKERCDDLSSMRNGYLNCQAPDQDVGDALRTLFYKES